MTLVLSAAQFRDFMRMTYHPEIDGQIWTMCFVADVTEEVIVAVYTHSRDVPSFYMTMEDLPEGGVRLTHIAE
jgi:hypothetical protein